MIRFPAMSSPEYLFALLATCIIIANCYPPPQRPWVSAPRAPVFYLGPRRDAGPRPYLSPQQAAQSPLGSVLRHTNFIPGSRLDISELVDVTELVPGPLGPVAAALVLSPVFSTAVNGITDLISNTATNNDPYLFQRGRDQFQRPVSPRFNLYVLPRRISPNV